MRARYRFRVRFRLHPEGVSVDPSAFETTLYYPAPDPGEEGWLFFRDNLWRGAVNAPDHLRRMASERLGVDVETVDFRAFELDAEYRTAFEGAVAANLDEFRADSVEEVVSKYLGSALDVREW